MNTEQCFTNTITLYAINADFNQTFNELTFAPKHTHIHTVNQFKTDPTHSML